MPAWKQRLPSLAVLLVLCCVLSSPGSVECSSNTALQRRPRRARPAAAVLEAEPAAAAKPFFVPIELTGSNAIENGKTVVWRESSWVRPDGNNPDTSAADWRLIRIRVEGEQTEWANVVSWTTGCGYLQWFKDTKQIRYTAEVDGCGETWGYDAVAVADENVMQEGTARIIVVVDNCFYSRCEQEGCGDACRCTSKATGNCHCGGGLAGFVDIYNWENNRESCVYDSFKPVNPSGATQGLFQTKLGNRKKVLIPIAFGRGSTRACLPSLASSKLKFTSVKCTMTSPKPDSRRATLAVGYPGAAEQGSVVGECSDDVGVYKVVVEVPQSVGQYNCVASFGDDVGDRVLGELKVK